MIGANELTNEKARSILYFGLKENVRNPFDGLSIYETGVSITKLLRARLMKDK